MMFHQDEYSGSFCVLVDFGGGYFAQDKLKPLDNL